MSDATLSEWFVQATAELIHSMNADGGWAYRAGDPSSTEPTALALLALASLPSPPALAAPTGYLTSRQRPDGFWSASDIHGEPSWTTPLAALAVGGQGALSAVQSAVDALLAESVYTLPATPVNARLYNYDTSIPGWPWSNGDYSFTEPTALSVIFLKRQGLAQAGRVRDAVRMLQARALPGLGWNYGEPKVLDGELFPGAAPTALALLALGDELDEQTAAATQWLQSQSGQLSSLFTLGWTAISLNVLGQLTDAWRTQVITRWSELPASRRNPLDTALCLLGLQETPHPFRVN